MYCIDASFDKQGLILKGIFLADFHQRTQKVTSKPREYLVGKFEVEVQAASFEKESELGGKKA